MSFHIPILTGVQNASKTAKPTHILSIEVFQVASNWFFRNVAKNCSFVFVYVVFLYISKIQVLKSR